MLTKDNIDTALKDLSNYFAIDKVPDWRFYNEVEVADEDSHGVFVRNEDDKETDMLLFDPDDTTISTIQHSFGCWLLAMYDKGNYCKGDFADVMFCMPNLTSLEVDERDEGLKVPESLRVALGLVGMRCVSWATIADSLKIDYCGKSAHREVYKHHPYIHGAIPHNEPHEAFHKEGG